MHSSVYIELKSIRNWYGLVHCGLQIMQNLSHHWKTALMKQKLQLFRVMLGSFCVDEPQANQK